MLVTGTIPGIVLCHDWNLTGLVLQQWKELYKFALKPWLPILHRPKAGANLAAVDQHSGVTVLHLMAAEVGVLTIIDFRGEGKKRILFHCPLKLMTFLKLLNIDEFRFL